MRPSVTALALCACALLMAVVSPVVVRGATADAAPWALASSADGGCAGLSALGASFAPAAGSAGSASAGCVSYHYADATAASNATDPVAISLSLSAVDPRWDVLHAVEVAADGRWSVASSALLDRGVAPPTASGVARRTPFPVGVEAAAVAMGPQPQGASGGGGGGASELLLLQSRPALSLSSLSLSTGTLTPILSASAMRHSLNVSHAVAGAMVLNSAAGEVYFVGLSGRTPPLPGGELDTQALKLFAVSIATGASAELELQGCADVVGLHFAEELGALLVVSSGELRAALLPQPLALGLVGSGLSALQTAPVSTVAPVAASEFLYAAQLEHYDALYTSARWVPLARQLILGIQLASSAPAPAAQPQALVVLDLSRTTSGGIQVDAVALSVVPSLPLAFHAGIAPLSLLAALPARVAPATQTQINVWGFGLGQALVHGSIVCELQPALADSTPIGAAYFVPATFNYSASASGGADQLSCALPAGAVPQGSVARLVLVRLSALQGRLAGRTTLALDVDECASATSVCPAGEVCSNSVGGFVCSTNTVCPAGTYGALCVPCPAGTFKSTTGTEACIGCPSGTSAPAGATKASDCKTESPCDSTTSSNGKPVSGNTKEEAVRMQLRVSMDLATFGATTSAAALQFRTDIAAALRVPLARISPVESVVADPSSTATSPAVLVTFQIYPPSASDRAVCMVEQHAGGNATSAVGQSADTLAKNLEGQLLDPTSPIYASPIGQNLKSDSLVASEGIALWVALLGDEGCPQLALMPFFILGGVLVLLASVYLCCPCRRPLVHGATMSPRARPFELWPTVLGLTAFAFDVFFLLVLSTLDISYATVLLAVGAAIVALGLVHNAATMVLFGRAQLKGLDAVSPAPALALAPGAVAVQGSPAKAGGSGVVRAVSLSASGKHSSHSSNASSVASNGVAPTDSPLRLWARAHPLGSKMAFAAGLINLPALGLFSAQLSPVPRASASGAPSAAAAPGASVFDLQWDSARAGSRPFHAMVHAGGVRSLLLRHLPMLVLQAVVLTMMPCTLMGAAPLVAGILATLALAARTLYTRGLPEPGAASKYTVVRKNGALPGLVVQEGNFFAEPLDKDEPSVSSVSRSSMSRSSHKKSGSMLTPGKNRVAAVVLAAVDSDEEEGGALGSDAAPAAGPDQSAEAGAGRSLPGQILAEGEAVVELELTEAEEAALRPHAWQVLAEVPGFAEHGVTGAGFSRAKRLPRKDAQKILRGRARQGLLSPAATAAADRKLDTTVSEEEVQLRLDAAAAARALVEAAPAASASASAPAAHAWILFDESSPLQPGDEVQAVEQFDEQTNLPYNPAFFQRYVKRAVETEESVAAKLQAEADAAAAAAAKEAEEKAAQDAAAAVAAAADAAGSEIPAEAQVDTSATAEEVATRAAAAEAARAAVSRNPHAWVLYDAETSGPLGPGDVVESVEQFDEATGLPFAPARFHQWIMRATMAEEEEKEQEAAPAPAPAAEEQLQESDEAKAQRLADEEAAEALAQSLAAQKEAEAAQAEAALAAESARAAAEALAQAQREAEEAEAAAAAAEAQLRAMDEEEEARAASAAILAQIEAAMAANAHEDQEEDVEVHEPEPEPEQAEEPAQESEHEQLAAAAEPQQEEQEEDDDAVLTYDAPAVAAAAEEEEEAHVHSEGDDEDAAAEALYGAPAQEEEEQPEEEEQEQRASEDDDAEDLLPGPRVAVDLGEDHSASTVVEVAAREAALAQERADRAAVSVSTLAGGREVVARGAVRSGAESDAAIIGDLGLVGRRAAAAAAPQTPSSSASPAQPSQSRLANGSAFSSPAPAVSAGGLFGGLGAKLAMAWGRGGAGDAGDDASDSQQAGLSRPASHERASSSASFGSEEQELADVESTAVTQGRRARNSSNGLQGGLQTVLAAASRGRRAAPPVLRSPSGVGAAGPTVTSPMSAVVAETIAARKVAKVMGFGSGSSREKLTADELRTQKQAAVAERKRLAAMAGAGAQSPPPAQVQSSPELAGQSPLPRNPSLRVRRPMAGSVTSPSIDAQAEPMSPPMVAVPMSPLGLGMGVAASPSPTLAAAGRHRRGMSGAGSLQLGSPVLSPSASPSAGAASASGASPSVGPRPRRQPSAGDLALSSPPLVPRVPSRRA